jgi:hypothetical protein
MGERPYKTTGKISIYIRSYIGYGKTKDSELEGVANIHGI